MKQILEVTKETGRINTQVEISKRENLNCQNNICEFEKKIRDEQITKENARTAILLIKQKVDQLKQKLISEITKSNSFVSEVRELVKTYCSN